MIRFTAVDWDWPLSTCGCEPCDGEGFVQVWWDECESCDECKGLGILFDWEMIEEERRTL
jgi:hypothetical protein